jgi:hypothetical protein
MQDIPWDCGVSQEGRGKAPARRSLVTEAVEDDQNQSSEEPQPQF